MEQQQTTYQDKTRGIDYWLLTFVFALVTLGLIIVFSASSVIASSSATFNNDAFYFLKRQFLWIIIGAIGMFAAVKLDLMKIRKLAMPLILIAIFLLTIVLIPGIGVSVSGGRRWLALGPLGFQPAEFAKLALIFYMADAIDRHKEKFKQLKGIIAPLIIMAIICVLIEKEPDLGTTLVVAGTFFGLIYLGGLHIKYIAGLFSAGVLMVAVRIFHESYRMKRILAFVNPWKDPQGSGYHIIQSLIALGSGGLFGVGLGQSRQKFFYLPEQHTDYIFAILGEELGLIGTTMAIMFFLVVIYRGFRISTQASYPFYRLLAAGITFMIGLQAFINIGVVTAILPPTGIPLPFISFGGSAMFFNLFSIGILLNISRHSIFND